jgi:hypothetical protein
MLELWGGSYVELVHRWWLGGCFWLVRQRQSRTKEAGVTQDFGFVACPRLVTCTGRNYSLKAKAGQLGLLAQKLAV